MKKIFSLFLLALFLINGASAQQILDELAKPQPKDSLPDLWIVTMDMSRSMIDAKECPGLPTVYQQLRRLMENHGANNEDDTFVLQWSGTDKGWMVARNGLGKTNVKFYDDGSDIVKDLILRTFFANGFEDLISRVRYLCKNKDLFRYDMSFTSLVRPLSIYELTEVEHFDFSQYRKIYHILITDDGDVNDQWMQDYKWMRKWAPKNFNRYNEILPSVACSEFDFTSRKAGKFVELETYSKAQPRIYLTEYVTYQNDNPERVFPADSLIAVADFHENSISFVLNCDDTSVVFAYISSCMVNGHEIQVNQYLYPGDEIRVNYDKSYGNALGNSISVEGFYQENYQDRILNIRPRNVDFKGAMPQNFLSAETKAIGKKLLASAIIILLLSTLFILLWRNMVVLRVFVNGKCWSIRRKAMNKLKYDDYTIATVGCSEMNKTNAFFYKGKGISITEDNNATKPGQGLLLIKTWWLGKLLSGMYQEDVPPTNNSDRQLRFENENGFQNGDTIHFSYSNRLSHTLIIRFQSQRSITQQKKIPLLQKHNLEMLSSYYEKNADKIVSVRNNVVVNIIYTKNNGDYAVLNIFDLNSQNSSNRIFLRYSLMCLFEKTKNERKKTVAIARLLEVARRVLKSEKQKAGYMGTNSTDPNKEQTIQVDVSPMLSYLFLLKRGKTRMVYSPFADGKLSLVSKLIPLFPREKMILKNMPTGYEKLVFRDEWGLADPTMIRYAPKNFKSSTLAFFGSDSIRLLDEEKNFSYGHPEPSAEGTAYYSVHLNKIN